MSSRRSVVHRTAVVTAGLTTAAVLTVATSSAATADPPALDVNPCEQTLLRAAEWPGTASDGSRLFSDAYDSYLSRQPECTTGT